MANFPRCQDPPKKKPEPPRISSNFWLNESNENLLKGCCCDPDNPIRLGDCFIVCALQQSPKARQDFCLLYPALGECEKERFDILMRDNPFLFKLVKDPTTVTDEFQASQNRRIPVRTAGPQGGRRQPIGCAPRPPHLTKGCC